MADDDGHPLTGNNSEAWKLVAALLGVSEAEYRAMLVRNATIHIDYNSVVTIELERLVTKGGIRTAQTMLETWSVSAHQEATAQTDPHEMHVTPA